VRDDVHVAHLITLLELGGAQDNTLYTVAHLRAPFRPALICGAGGMLDDEARSLPGIPVHFVPSLGRSIRPLRDLRALLALVRILRRMRPAIVHTHSSKAGILGRLAARLTGVPVVVHSIHGYGFHDGQPRVLRALLIAAERLAARCTTRFVAVSRANLQRGIEIGLFPAERAALIRSGIHLAEFDAAGRDPEIRRGAALRREIGAPEGAPLVGMVACLKPQKDPLAFVEAAARVRREVPETRFLLVGDGALRDVVRRRAARLGLGDRLHLLGWRRDVPRIVAALDVLVLTSLWEGLPRVVPEAIAASVPIVATLADGTADLLRDGVTGLAAPLGDVAGIAERIVRLLRDPALGRDLAARARAVLPEFDIDAMVRAQETLYRDLLREAGRAIEAAEGAGGPVHPAEAARREARWTSLS
jgi:glycosyltransferase involved in cell wall biosynthesis